MPWSVAILLAWSPANAAPAPSPAPSPDQLKSGTPLSVYKVSPALDAGVIGLTALGSVLPYAYAGHLIHPRCPCDPAEVNSLDRSVIGNSNPFLDSLSDVTTGVVLAAPVILDGMDLGFTPELTEDLVVYAETLSVNGALVTLAKYTVQRPLPRTYAGDPRLINEPGGYRSFYSGHTSLTFAALSAASVTLNLRYGAGVWPWLVTGGIGLSVAAERVAAGRHFYTDVLVGAAAGTLVGTVIPLLHSKASGGAGSSGSFHVLPAANGLQGVWVQHM